MFLTTVFHACVKSQQEPMGWQPNYIWREPSMRLKAYLMFLLIACVICGVRLIRIWWIAAPFSRARVPKDMGYLRLLYTASRSIKQWITLIFLVWGIFMATNLYDVCFSLLGEKVVGSFDLLIVLEDYSAILVMTLSAVLFHFVARWHILTRIDVLSNQ